MKTCVYKIISSKTGKFYIGSTTDFSKRIKQHTKTLENLCHPNINLQKVFNRYGLEDLQYRVLREFDSVKQAQDLEAKLIKKYLDNKLCLNVLIGSTGGDTLTRLSKKDREDRIKRISDTVNQNISLLTVEQRKEIWGKSGKENGMYGKTHTKEVKEKLSKRSKDNSYATGSIRTKEQRKCLSEKMLERAKKKDYVNPFAGKKHTKETREILSKARIGKKPSNCRKVKIGKDIYPSATEAARQLNVCTATILHRIKSDNYPKFKYLS